MSQTKDGKGSWRLIVARFFVRVLMFVIPLRGKRVFFIGSVFACVSSNVQWRKENFSKIQQYMAKLNDVLDVVDEADSLALPALFHHVIWTTDDIETYKHDLSLLAKDDDINKLITRCKDLVEDTPKWLRYSRRDDMARDIATLLHQYFHVTPMEAM